MSSKRQLEELTTDMLEWLQDVRGEDLLALDADLTAHGLPTLTAMRSAENRRFLAILDRGRIRNEVEYRFVNARLANVDNTGPSPEEREIANGLLLAYEP